MCETMACDGQRSQHADDGPEAYARAYAEPTRSLRENREQIPDYKSELTCQTHAPKLKSLARIMQHSA